MLGAYLVWRTGLRDRGVITDHLEFGRRLLHGLDVYAPFEGKPLHPPYPPSFGLLVLPFALLPERAARFTWGIAQVLCLWSLACRLRHAVPPLDARRFHIALVFTALLASRYILRDTHGGGGNLINLWLVVGAWTAARGGHPTRAGLLLGLSLVTKPVGVLVVPLLWLVGSTRAAISSLVCAAGYVVVALALLHFDPSPFIAWLEGSFHYGTRPDVFAAPERGFPEFSWMNQCLRCAVARTLGEVPREFAEQVPWFVPGLGLAAPTVAWFARGAAALLLVGTFLRIRAGAASRTAWSLAAVLALSLLLSPISWKAHHVGLIPALFSLGALAARGARWPWVFGGGYFLLCVLGEEVVGKEFKNVQQSSYFTTLGTLGLLAICLAHLGRPGATPTVPTPLPPR
ncbi:MAG: DUF2029 domain-containing protein [Planctomycetes bacterium]|nr:DUF2029 domain-containing protein [Planctomycetota bacterium]